MSQNTNCGGVGPNTNQGIMTGNTISSGNSGNIGLGNNINTGQKGKVQIGNVTDVNVGTNTGLIGSGSNTINK